MSFSSPQEKLESVHVNLRHSQPRVCIKLLLSRQTLNHIGRMVNLGRRVAVVVAKDEVHGV